VTDVILDWDKKKSKGIIVSDHLDLIRNHFSVPNDAKKFSRNSWAPDRLGIITGTGRFDLGLYYTILKFTKSGKYKFSVSTTQRLQEKLLTGTEEYEIPKLKLPPRDFQNQGVRLAATYGFGTFVVGTGGGKTLLMALITETFKSIGKEKTLIGLPPHLVEQTTSDFIEYGIPEEDISKWDGRHELQSTRIVIASYKIIQSKLTKDKEETVKQLKDIDLLLLDEVHCLRKMNKLNKAINTFTTFNRFGFTGTLPDNLLDKWNIIGKVGPILLDINSYQLREEGLLSNVKALILAITYNNPPKFTSSQEDKNRAYREERNFIQTNTFRNSLIRSLCTRFDNNCLILVNQIAHGKLLFDLLGEAFPDKRIFWVSGETGMKDRELIKGLMETETNIICIAITKIFSTGVNIKNLHYIIFAQGGKAKVTMIQAIGRGLRLHKSKPHLLIIDIADMLKYGTSHLQMRKKRYNEEKISYEITQINEPKHRH